MAITIDHVLSETKLAQTADLVKDVARKSGLGDDVLQRVNERGGEFQQAVLAILIRLGSKVALITTALLEAVTIVRTRTVRKFVAKDKFQVGETDGVKIGWLGSNFRQYLLGKIERNVLAAELRVHRLRKGSTDSPIVKDLGGKEVVITSLAQMWQLMKRQGHGQEETLAVDGKVNIFYIEDGNGTLWAVYCNWYADDGAWDVEARQFDYPGEWVAGNRVISR